MYNDGTRVPHESKQNPIKNKNPDFLGRMNSKGRNNTDFTCFELQAKTKIYGLSLSFELLNV